MKRLSQGRYTLEFRGSSRAGHPEGLTSGEASRRFSLPKSTLENWVRMSKAGKLTEIGKSQRPLTEIEVELTRIKRELAITKMERDLQKMRQRTLPRSRCKVRADEAMVM